jgi:hypothetical protein
LEKLLAGRSDRIFNAYVNIGSLAGDVKQLREAYPSAKFILTTTNDDTSDMMEIVKRSLDGADITILDKVSSDKWQVICEHLRCAPPNCMFPVLEDLGQRAVLDEPSQVEEAPKCEQPKWDESPWVVAPSPRWRGVRLSLPDARQWQKNVDVTSIQDDFTYLDTRYWLLRSDTFTDNLALFRPANVEFEAKVGATLSVKKEHLGVREYSAASICSRNKYLFGRFEAAIRASNVPGVVTGFFLHRNSPRQEIDIEITGNRPNRLIVNVFYNPGGLGADFNYGYRGSPSYIDLGFDASKETHLFAIEWSASEIRWLVDDHVVHRRDVWNPTPIPHLPLTLHINSWITRSAELAGRVKSKKLPSAAIVEHISLTTGSVEPSDDADCIDDFN